jgi:uracil-DNA glycosylase family 4
MDKKKIIEEHYKKVHACSKCFNSTECNVKKDPSKVIRKVVKGALNSDIFLVAQSIAERSQRLSGMPYTFTNGLLSATGRKLDRFLSLIGYTIVPNSGRKLVYSSDIVHCYPGKKNNGAGDNKPTPQEIRNCHDWLTKEIKIIKPKALLLLGRIAAETFFQFYTEKQLGKFSSRLMKEFRIKIDDLNLSVFILPHPASMYPQLSTIYEKTMALIKH